MKPITLVLCCLLPACYIPYDPNWGGNGDPAADAGPPDAGAPGEDAGPAGPDPCFTTTALAAGRTHPNGGSSYFTMRSGSDTREYLVHVPAGYTGEYEVPVVFALHGMFQDAVKFGLNGSDMEAKSDEEGFIVVFPNGLSESWNAGACCPNASLVNRDDVGFLRNLVGQLVSAHGLCVDRERVYAAGFSNGGYMTYRLGCQDADVFAAVVSVAGGLVYDQDVCASQMTRPVPMLHIHGAEDALQPIGGAGTITALGSIEAWAAFNGCDSTPVPATLPPVSQLDTTCTTYPNCDDGAETSFCAVAGGGHCWFGNDTCGAGGPNGDLLGGNAEGIVATDAAWDFLSRHSCPSCEN